MGCRHLMSSCCISRDFVLRKQYFVQVGAYEASMPATALIGGKALKLFTSHVPKLALPTKKQGTDSAGTPDRVRNPRAVQFSKH